MKNAIVSAILFSMLTFASVITAQGATTLENLQTAYNGEMNAKARYEAFAAKAKEEGYASVATLFHAAAYAEKLHADKHASNIKKLGSAPKATLEKADVKTTKENLEAAIKGEEYENTSMYPEFIKQAEADKNSKASMSFKGAMATEASHAELYKKALSELDSWKAPGKQFLVCKICGYTTMDGQIVKCPVCAAPRSEFKKFE